MEKIEVGIYSVVRIGEKDEENFVDYGLPFCAIDDRAACGMVREALKGSSVFKSVNADNWFLKKIGYFYPSSENYPVVSLQPTLVAKCGDLMKGVEEIERENV